MSNEREQVLAKLKEEFALIETRARKVSARIEVRTREKESSKIAFLQQFLEEQMKSEARRRGLVSLIKDKKRLRGSLLVAAGGFILGGLITKDKFAALHAGLSSFDGALQGFGDTKWVVSLGKKVVVAPSESTTSEGEWIAWESVKLAMGELKNRALGGEVLGDLDDVISRLKRGRRGLVFVRLPVAK